ncbi:MAG: CBS domain-containing protein [Caldilineaceae bacterium]
MQGIVLLGVFLKSTPFLERRQIGQDELMAGVEKSLRKYFGKRSEQVIQDNLTCVRRGFAEVQQIPQAIIDGEDAKAQSNGKVVSDLMHPHGHCVPPHDTTRQSGQSNGREEDCLIVVIDNEGNLQGTVSQNDLLRAQSSNGNGANGNWHGNGTNGSGNGHSHDWGTTKPRNLCAAMLSPAPPAESIREAMQRLIDHHVDSLIVVERENGHAKPVGTITAADFARVG